MIRAKHHPLYVRASDWIMKMLLHRHFRHIQIQNNLKDRQGPVLLLANHFSWWDGFLARYAITKTLKKKVFVMMLEEELSKRPFLRKVGAFSIRRNSRSVTETIKYAQQVLQNPDHLLLIFPQGRFQSSHQYPLGFEDGWFRILQGAPGNTRVVFLAALTDYFAFRKPGLYIYLDEVFRHTIDGRDQESAGQYEGADNFGSPEAAETAYNHFLKKAVEQQNRLATTRS